MKTNKKTSTVTKLTFVVLLDFINRSQQLSEGFLEGNSRVLALNVVQKPRGGGDKCVEGLEIQEDFIGLTIDVF